MRWKTEKRKRIFFLKLQKMEEEEEENAESRTNKAKKDKARAREFCTTWKKKRKTNALDCSARRNDTGGRRMKSGKTSRKQRRKAVRSEGSENRPPHREGRHATEVGARSSKLKNCVKEARDHIRVLRDRVQELESTGENNAN